jgi:type VI secretion system secreted protein Hcp
MGIFLKLGDIESDAVDEKHKKWVLCDSFTGGTSHAMFAETGGGMIRNDSDVEVHDIGLRMQMHAGSAKMFIASIVGKPCKAEIHITRANDPSGAENYLEVVLTDTYVTHYSMDCDGDTPTESISLNFTKIETKFIPTKSDGKPGDPVPFGFCKMTGKKL